MVLRAVGSWVAGRAPPSVEGVVAPFGAAAVLDAAGVYPAVGAPAELPPLLVAGGGDEVVAPVADSADAKLEVEQLLLLAGFVVVKLCVCGFVLKEVSADGAGVTLLSDGIKAVVCRQGAHALSVTAARALPR